MPEDPTEVFETTQEVVEHPSVDTSDKFVVTNVTPKNIFFHPDAHPIVLDLLLLKKYGLDWLEWESETLELRVPEDFGVSSLSDINLAKLQACRTMHMVDSFWTNWEVFNWCTMSLTGVFPDFNMMQVPTVAQCLVSVDIAKRIREDVPFSPEVAAFIVAVHRHDGIFLPIPPLDDFVVIPPEFYPDHEGMPSPADIKRVFAVARGANKVPMENNLLDEQVRRLMVINQVLEESRAHLRHQMGFLNV